MALTIEEEIYSLALGAMGDYQIEEGKTNTNEYLVCAQFYDQARKRAIKSHPWNECIKRQIIPRDEYAPIFEYDYQYAVPSDRLRVLSIAQTGIDLYQWEVEGSYIVTNYSETPREWAAGEQYTAGEYVNEEEITYLCNTSNTATISNQPSAGDGTWTALSGTRGVIYCRYIYDNDTPSTYSEDLKNAIAIQLAILIAPRLQNDPATKNLLIQEYNQLTLPQARSVDAQEGKPRRWYSSRWNRSRNGFQRRSR